MTQKELLYVEDAIGHEKNIISICKNTINNLTDKKLISFIEEEINKHILIEKRLIKMLEVKNG